MHFVLVRSATAADAGLKCKLSQEHTHIHTLIETNRMYHEIYTRADRPRSQGGTGGTTLTEESTPGQFFALSAK